MGATRAGHVARFMRHMNPVLPTEINFPGQSGRAHWKCPFFRGPYDFKKKTQIGPSEEEED